MSTIRDCARCGEPFEKPWKSRTRTCSLLCKFALMVEDAPEGACKTWRGFRNPLGYGMIRVSQSESMRLAHRVAFQLFVGDIPDGMCVCHRCDNPACVNVAHLFLGTNADNVADKMAKGRDRYVRGGEHWTRAKPWLLRRGEEHAQATLSEEGVALIRSMSAAGIPTGVIAKQFGVAWVTIDAVIKRKTWRHVA